MHTQNIVIAIISLKLNTLGTYYVQKKFSKSNWKYFLYSLLWKKRPGFLCLPPLLFIMVGVHANVYIYAKTYFEPKPFLCVDTGENISTLLFCACTYTWTNAFLRKCFLLIFIFPKNSVQFSGFFFLSLFFGTRMIRMLYKTHIHTHIEVKVHTPVYM